MRATSASRTGALAALLTATSAHAIGPVDVEIAGRLGYASTPSSTYFGTLNPLDLGFGVRAGASYRGIYAGVSVIDYEGQSTLTTVGIPGGLSAHTLMEGGEVGYTLPIPFRFLKIRPLVGVGNATLTIVVPPAPPYSSFDQVPGSSTSYLYVEPGLLVMVPISVVFVGVDTNVLLFPKMEYAHTVLSIHGQLGVRF